ncbi:GerAB/ArcD/ProY family transporter [Bacillaceae bacterium CLA-AA-H227]|uniref:GerAB/ArcD/ProY family transporter n=1 Tax=Robertmurraya yapensis (ex Hitch et al 2024) TaxID=3133160 RepID=A0ACC6S628_9BACI
MKQQISVLQYACIIGNFIFTGTLVLIPQLIIEISKQNSWIVVIVTFLFIYGIVYFLSSQTDRIKKIKGVFNSENKSWYTKVFLTVFLFFMLSIFIRDLQALNGFIDAVLLPKTPIDVIAFLSILSLTYISLTGIEVIARITVIHFLTISIIIVALPFLLLNEIELAYLQPIGGINFFSELIKSVYIYFSWIAEVVIFIFLLIFIEPFNQLRKASILGLTCGLVVLLILMLLNITVLGVAVASEATYPNFALIQQINLTDFLDRLDLIIVVVWLPTMLCKLALLLFGIQKLLNVIRGKDSDFSIIPLGILLGLTNHFFKNNIASIEYSFFTWPTLGMILELIIILGFIFFKYFNKKNKGKNNEIKA